MIARDHRVLRDQLERKTRGDAVVAGAQNCGSRQVKGLLADGKLILTHECEREARRLTVFACRGCSSRWKLEGLFARVELILADQFKGEGIPADTHVARDSSGKACSLSCERSGVRGREGRAAAVA